MRISVTLVGDRELVAKLDRLPLSVRDALIRKMQALTLMLQGYIQSEKLSGQVLNVVTGALRRSVQAQPVEVQGEVVTGSVASSGDVKYAAVHEFGFEGDVTVRQHLRDTVFGRKVDPYLVGPYTMRMNMPERSFMRTGLSDKEELIRSGLRDAVQEEISRQIGQ